MLLPEWWWSQPFYPVKCHPLIKSYIILRTAYSAVVILKLPCSSLEHAWPLMNEPLVLGLAPLSLKPPHSAPYTCTLYYESAEFKFQSVPVIDILHLHSLTDSWCTFMQQFMTLSWLFSQYNKENNKSSVYNFLQYPGCKTGMYPRKMKACATIGATCKAIQYTNMIYGAPPSPFRLPSISTATITLCSIFLVLAAWIDAHNLYTFRQILNRKHQTTA